MPSSSEPLAVLTAYATEGGLDGPFEPATCYNAMCAFRQYDYPGEALGLWRDYEALLDAAADDGVRELRLQLSWARIEPRPGEVNEAALDRYRAVVAHATRRDIAVEVSACDGAWPAWLGFEPWLWAWTTPVTLAHLERVATALPDAVGWTFHSPTEQERGFTHAQGPPWRRRARADAADSARRLAAIVDDATAKGWLRPRWNDRPTTPLVEGVGPLARGPARFERRDGYWVSLRR